MGKNKRPAPPPAARGATISGGLAAALIAGAVVLVYANTINAPFIFDDGPGISLNVSIRHLWPLGPVLQPSSDGATGVSGRPIVNLSLAVNYAISGLKPWSYHATNTLIHLLAALTLFGLTRRTLEGPVLRGPWAGKSVPVAFGLALLWAVHPLQTESVTCVIQRTESLVGLFYLLTLYGYARAATAAAPNERIRWSILSIAFCALGMGTKEVMVTLPVIALLHDRTFLSGSFAEAWRRHRWLHYGFIATWALLFYLMLDHPMRGGTAGYDTVTWWHYLLTQCRAIVFYLKLAFWPHPLVLDYGMAVVRDPLAVLPQAILLVALAGGTVWALVRRPVIGFLGAWWFIILSPSSSVVPLVTQTIAEHRVYLPLAAIIALGLGALAVRSARLVLPVCVGVALIFGGMTIRRNQLYRAGGEAVWRANLADWPDNLRAYSALAAVADRAERFEEAVVHYEEYLRRRPDDIDVEFNYARDLAKLSRWAEAIQHFEKILRATPGDPEVRVNYGAALIASGRVDEGVRQFELIMRVRRNVASDHFNLAEALVKAGRAADALPHYQEAVALDSSVALHQYRYGDALLRAERPAEAVAAYREAVRLKPDNFAAWVNLGGCLLMIGRPAEAVTALETALRLKPDDQACRANLEYARSQLPR